MAETSAYRLNVHSSIVQQAGGGVAEIMKPKHPEARPPQCSLDRAVGGALVKRPPVPPRKDEAMILVLGAEA